MDLITTNLKKCRRENGESFIYVCENFEFRMLHTRFKLENVSNFKTFNLSSYFRFFEFKSL